jgi:predicted transcriptional regulator
MVQCTVEQRVIVYGTNVKYGFARKWRCKFRDEGVSSRQTVHSLVNKLRATGLLIDKKEKHKRRVLTEKLNDIGARLEHNVESH